MCSCTLEIAASIAFRCRHGSVQQADPLMQPSQGLEEADETYVLRNHAVEDKFKRPSLFRRCANGVGFRIPMAESACGANLL